MICGIECLLFFLLFLRYALIICHSLMGIGFRHTTNVHLTHKNENMKKVKNEGALNTQLFFRIKNVNSTHKIFLLFFFQENYIFYKNVHSTHKIILPKKKLKKKCSFNTQNYSDSYSKAFPIFLYLHPLGAPFLFL